MVSCVCSLKQRKTPCYICIQLQIDDLHISDIVHMQTASTMSVSKSGMKIEYQFDFTALTSMTLSFLFFFFPLKYQRYENDDIQKRWNLNVPSPWVTGGSRIRWKEQSMTSCVYEQHSSHLNRQMVFSLMKVIIYYEKASKNKFSCKESTDHQL